MLDGRTDRGTIDGIRRGLDGDVSDLTGQRLTDTLRERLEYPHHRQMLIEGSGISPAVVAERGYHTVKTKAELARLGFSRPQRREPALVIPMYCPTGELATHQIRPDAPREADEGRPIKYETPPGLLSTSMFIPARRSAWAMRPYPCGSRRVSRRRTASLAGGSAS